MNDKNLNFRYFFYFIISLFFIVLVINILKDKEMKNSLSFYKKYVNKEYAKKFNTYKDISELIYFNEFIKDNKITEILKSNLDSNFLKQQLLLNFENSFLFYKTLGLEETSFYSLKNEIILSMEDRYKDNFTSKIVEKVISNKKELFTYKIENEKISLLFSKPIFDEKLNLLGVMNLEFNSKDLIKNLEENSSSKFRIVISNNFQLKEEIFFNMKQTQKDELIEAINNQKEFFVVLNKKLRKIPIVFSPIDNSDFHKNGLYLIAYNDNKENEFTKINSYFDTLFMISILVMLIIVYLLYRTNNFKMKSEIIKKKYEELYEQVDNYIIKVETDLSGNIISATKPFYKISGYSKEEMLGKNTNMLRHPDVSKVFFENMWKDLKENKIWEGEIKNRDKYGNSYWIKAVIFPRYNFEGKLEGYSSIRINITDTKQLRKINRLLKEDLSNKLNDIKIKDKTLIDATKVQLMSKILDSFAHQWKVPISRISFEIQKLKQFKDTNLINIEKSIELELKNLSNMLNEIKYLFDTRNSEKTNLLLVMKETILVLEDEFKKQNIKVKFDIKPEINISISFNELKSIFLNILKNCLEQTILNKAENVTIYISAICEDLDDNNDVVIKIEDNIKGENKKIIIDEILTSNEEKYFDTYLHLSKLFIEKNSGLLWCNNTIYNTTYFIKLNKEE